MEEWGKIFHDVVSSSGEITPNINGLVQERRNSIANALKLCLSHINLSIWNQTFLKQC